MNAEVTEHTGLRAMPRGVWALGFVSLFMDISSEMIHGLLPVFLTTVLGASAEMVGLIEGIGEATASITKLFSGWISDRLGKRKAFVFLSAAIQGVAALLLAFVPELSAAMVAAGLLGLGYGCFLSVDQALATQVLPDPESRGKDLGIMNIATAVPQAMAPLLGAGIVAALGGFMGLFILSGLFAFAGALAVARVKAVR